MLKSVNELFPLSSKDVVSSVSKLSPMNPIIAPAIGIIKLKATIIPINYIYLFDYLFISS